MDKSIDETDLNATQVPTFSKEQSKTKSRARGMPVNARNVLYNAIRDKCRDCEGDHDPCVEWRIGNCLVKSCPLRPARPYQHLEGKEIPYSLRENIAETA